MFCLKIILFNKFYRNECWYDIIGDIVFGYINVSVWNMIFWCIWCYRIFIRLEKKWGYKVIFYDFVFVKVIVNLIEVRIN